ncbi:hypothetical protein GCM10022409_23670 [Hymenobacter glaciei]|uniref:Glycosyltransferase RgtA/B/C/D-like domain-containing protein n=1 Tax=Hymenobacter glaciei TaxID=877209 RepID=A0ABP7U8F7_9BACT
MLDFSRSSPQQHRIVRAFFGTVLLLGLLIFRQFGISVDENQQRDTGMVSLKHVAMKISPSWVENDDNFDRYGVPLDEYQDRDYGVAFEAPVSFLERVLRIDDWRNKFLLRHLFTFLISFGGMLAVYQLAARRFHDWRVGLLAASWLLLSPRLFAESFYNDKDAVFMALFAIATNTAVQLLLRPTTRRAAWHALACAIAIDVRIMAVLVPLATGALLLWRGLRSEVAWPRVARTLALYGGLLVVLVVALWPYLWPAPLTNLFIAFRNMAAFRWGGLVLYMGDLIPATEIPWHYALVWMGITTPVLYLAAGGLGIGLVVRELLRQRWRLWVNDDQLQDVLFLGLGVGPLLVVIALHSVLYDGWRQLYFVYPMLLLLAVRGWAAAAKWRPRAVRAITVVSAVVIGFQMILMHPLQMLYFNVLAGPNVAERFEMDYWGLGYQQDLVYIAEHDTRSSIKVYSPPPSPAPIALQMLPNEQRERIQMVDQEEGADYIITNYRWHPQAYSYPPGAEVYQLRADGRRVHSIFQLRW